MCSVRRAQGSSFTRRLLPVEADVEPWALVDGGSAGDEVMANGAELGEGIDGDAAADFGDSLGADELHGSGEFF